MNQYFVSFDLVASTFDKVAAMVILSMSPIGFFGKILEDALRRNLQMALYTIS